eukprot:CAMPEP_0113723210 /NCGR_PEP_ID=MMETSP0038_2-20120614/38269_1 /TAXON_ID=2898 /ORGANISM="Cryptomonas paramecium" /LENGTH=302 /DNA_ID=CAMNT_0000652719 /DNA_START=12 /DNA_END=920 /DNA_ORIENTATION=+ /assembly_acc=CAM_ASM_000170
MTFNNSRVISSAPGCKLSFSATFMSSLNATSAPIVVLCERNSKGHCIQRFGVNLTRFQRSCCESPFLARPSNCTSIAQSDSPLSIFQCVQLDSVSINTTTSVNVTFLAPYQSDLVNDGQNEICLIAKDTAASNTWSLPYCIVYQVERCSVCVSRGQTLSTLAAKFGTHWTQIYSGNTHLNDPNDIAEGQLVRWGLVYGIKAQETLLSLSLRFGVGVDRILFWNPQLLSLGTVPPSTPASSPAAVNSYTTGYTASSTPSSTAAAAAAALDDSAWGAETAGDQLARFLPAGFKICVAAEACFLP